MNTMMNIHTNIKILAIILVILVTSSLVLFALKKISTLVFWGVIIFSAIIAYKVIPYLKEREIELG